MQVGRKEVWAPTKAEAEVGISRSTLWKSVACCVASGTSYRLPRPVPPPTRDTLDKMSCFSPLSQTLTIRPRQHCQPTAAIWDRRTAFERPRVLVWGPLRDLIAAADAKMTDIDDKSACEGMKELGIGCLKCSLLALNQFKEVECGKRRRMLLLRGQSQPEVSASAATASTGAAASAGAASTGSA